jgi:hypothetical protein
MKEVVELLVGRKYRNLDAAEAHTSNNSAARACRLGSAGNLHLQQVHAVLYEAYL